jgi:hypothetical protein
MRVALRTLALSVVSAVLCVTAQHCRAQGNDQLATLVSAIEAGGEINFPVKYNCYTDNDSGNEGSVLFENALVTLSKSKFELHQTIHYNQYNFQAFALPPEKILELAKQPQFASRIKVTVLHDSLTRNMKHKEIKGSYYIYDVAVEDMGGGSIACTQCGDSMDVLFALLTKFRAGQWAPVEVAPEPVAPLPPPMPPSAQRQYDDIAPPPPPPAPAPTISMGQTKSQVIAAFGEPQRKAVAGPKQIFFYTDLKMKVTFTNGKVSSIE